MSNERRTRRLCWVALAVLLPVALWTEAREGVARASPAHAFEEIDVGPTQTAPFAGLKWRLLDVAATENVKTPANSEVIVRVQLDLTSPEAVQSLGSCQPYLEDSTGQRWSPMPPRFRETPCSAASLRAETSGTQAVITERFMIPTARASDVNFAIVIPKEQPRYLRFQRSVQ